MTTDYDKLRAIQTQLKTLRDELAEKSTGAFAIGLRLEGKIE